MLQVLNHSLMLVLVQGKGEISLIVIDASIQTVWSSREE